MDTISHSDPSLHRKFYMHQENNAFYDKKKCKLTLLGHSEKTLTYHQQHLHKLDIMLHQ